MTFIPAGRVARGAVVVAAVGLTAALAGAAPAATANDRHAATANDRHAATADEQYRGHCTQSLQGWTEQTMQYYSTGTQVPPAREVGDAVIYNDYVFAQANNHVGHAIGYVSVLRKLANGDLDSYYHATYDLPDGQLNAVGNIDRTAMFEGKPVVFRVTGTIGAYAGKHGTIVWQLQHVPATIDTRVSLGMKLCG